MCGITGIYRYNGLVDDQVLSDMTQSLAHRGPDAQDTWTSTDETCGLGHTRLSVIDLAGGSQPMKSADGRYVIVFNGEIYNFAELRAELSHQTFHTNSDTETILEAYRKWGTECLTKLRGMFALAIYDTTDQSLFLARDRTGIKPLYWFKSDEIFCFGSEIKAVMCAREVPRKINPEALVDYLVLGYPLVPKTLFDSVYEMEPGTWLEISPRGMETGRFWSWQRSEVACGFQEAIEHSQAAIDRSVNEHLVADVPIGAFLSGGIDSSLLVHSIVRQSNQTLDTFNVRFSEAAYDESPYARQVAEHLGTRHHEITIENAKCDFDLLDKILLHFDQPFADSSAIPCYLISEEIRKHVKVVIGGDGGDEMFGGYPRFSHANLAKKVGRLPTWCLTTLNHLNTTVGKFSPSLKRQAHRFLSAARARNGDRLLNLSCYSYTEEIARIVEQAYHPKTSGYFPTLDDGKSPGAMEFVRSTIRYALPGDYLRKVDMTSSAHGLEVRIPFLGEHVLSHAASLPERWLISRRRNKPILRQLAQDCLPAAVATKAKAGFGIPVDEWLGDEGRRLLRDEMLSPNAKIADLVSLDYRKTLLDGFVSRNWDQGWASRFNMYQRVYLLWALERWCRHWNPSIA